ncbi:MAG: hypothetical protein M1820_010437 [Bogoriella megaspora]|nr:MAG: hypothetical protein M1820_010437 [Bogoriella megaspora]
MVDECCRTGFKWDGRPVGREGTLDKNRTYITGTNEDAAVLLVHDLYGWTLPNLRLLADHFAQEAHCTCYIPDFYNGEGFSEETLDAAVQDPARFKLLDLESFFERNSKEKITPELIACAKALKLKYKRVGAVGYCWGGWGCLRLAARGNDLVDCISIAHPSFVEKSEIDAIGVPIQIVAPETDSQLTPELKEYCNKVIPTFGVPYQYDYYPDLSHGFAGKGDPKDKKQKDGLERAKNSAVSWFNVFLHPSDA